MVADVEVNCEATAVTAATPKIAPPVVPALVTSNEQPEARTVVPNTAPPRCDERE